MFWPLFPSITQYCFLLLLHFSLHLLLCSSPLFYAALLRTAWPQHSEKQCLEKLYGRGEHQLAVVKRCKQPSVDDKNTFSPFDTFTPSQIFFNTHKTGRSLFSTFSTPQYLYPVIILHVSVLISRKKPNMNPWTEWKQGRN